MAYWNDALRREVGRLGVTVCLVEPGPVRTEFFDAAAVGRKSEPGPWDSQPPGFVSATPEDVARRIARLVERPKRRISVLRRVVWPLAHGKAKIPRVHEADDLLGQGIFRIRKAGEGAVQERLPQA